MNRLGTGSAIERQLYFDAQVTQGARQMNRFLQ